ncbi:hypothetical protein CANARDRAFT_29806 [[Candida] arabinofermentans NRRL YB-2248]|uniref:Uncharacterized protein n=1 Tax=[Candida] arabinofermentans NRRL YB-2248 TaxID=983967 RepID=A0A1E4SVP0_9ASCO|nr:hypothetical protein CANARDRAFT_29806 [[Candida] arabinofermentans NRRL YB-2248]
MGVCASKEPSSIKPVQQRLGTSNTQVKQPQQQQQQQKVKQEGKQLNTNNNNTSTGGGHKLGSNTDTGSLSAKELAAKAAEERYLKEKNKNESGELGKKLAAINKKSGKEHAMDSYNDKKTSK